MNRTALSPLLVSLALLLSPLAIPGPIGCRPAMASQEGVLPISKFYVQSEGVDGFGEIAVEGQKDASMLYKKVLVKAFGKLYRIDEAILRRIPAHNQNGISLSCEKGTKNANERAVYIIFTAGYTSGTKEAFTIALFEDGTQNVIESL